MSKTTWSETGYRSGSARYVAYMALTLLALALLLVLPFHLDPEMRTFYLSEGGPIQVFSAAGYLVVATTLVRELSSAELRRHWYLVIIPVAMCLRELDFQAHFTTYSLTKTLLYVSPDVPLWEKLFGVIVFLVLGVAGYLLVARHFRAYLHGLPRFYVPSLAVAAAILSAIASKALDGAESNLAFLGIDVASTFVSIAIEEVLELGIPLFLTIAVFSYFAPEAGSERMLPMRSAGTNG